MAEPKRPRDPKKFKLWERALLLFAFLLFGASSFFYFSGFPLRTYLLGWEREVQTEGVGYLEFTLGDIRRKKHSSPTFEKIRQQDRLYNYDTIVTGTDGGATLTLDDGSSIDLGPNTMVKLEFATKLALDGVSRSATVQVVAGKVTGKLNPAGSEGEIIIQSRADFVRLSKGTTLTSSLKVAAPTLKPTRPSDQLASDDEEARLAALSEDERKAFVRLRELKEEKEKAVSLQKNKLGVKLIYPKHDDVVTLYDGSKELVRRTDFQWEVSPPDAEIRFTLRMLSIETERSEFQEIISRVVQGENGKGHFIVDLDLPGRYEWELQGVEERLEGTGKLWHRFTLDPTFRGIDVQEPLIGGKPVRSNEYIGSPLADFDITLVWDPFPKATYYQVDVFKDPADRIPVLEKRVAEPRFSINKDKVFSGKVYYRIATELRSGFTATSGMTTFRFDFLPPVAVLPKDGARITGADIAKDDGKILFTWQKTNYTDAYEIQISSDEGFAKVVTSVRTEENFALIKALPQGRYFWRLRSIGKGASSPPSPYRAFSVAR